MDELPIIRSWVLRVLICCICRAPNLKVYFVFGYLVYRFNPYLLDLWLATQMLIPVANHFHLSGSYGVCMSLGCHVSCVSVLAHILCSFGVCNSWTCVFHAIPLFYMLYVIYVSPITRTLINTLTLLGSGTCLFSVARSTMTKTWPARVSHDWWCIMCIML